MGLCSMQPFLPPANSEMLQIAILGSGSSGNCLYVETPRTRFLVDAGLTARQIGLRLESIGRTLADIDALLLTHEHTDHTRGLNVLAKKLRLPVYTNRLTRDALARQLSAEVDWKLFRAGDGFSLQDVQVDSFSLPHDACDPVGFTLAWGEEKVGVLTDLGYAPEPVLERVRGCTALLLETNHDTDLLHADTKRPWAVKQRILARHGHLSNDEAADVAEVVLSDQLRHLFLCHLSRDCNRPDLARHAISSRLARLGADSVSIHETYPDRACNPLKILSRSGQNFPNHDTR